MLIGDIGSAYLNVYTIEKIYYHAGPERGPALEDTVYESIRVLYGLKPSTNALRQALCHTINKKMGLNLVLLITMFGSKNALALIVHCITHIS